MSDRNKKMASANSNLVQIYASVYRLNLTKLPSKVDTFSYLRVKRLLEKTAPMVSRETVIAYCRKQYKKQ